ncbi:MAG: DNA primase [Chlamydiota bacterium]|nr:DNA primase [Chlamydiota bacterium]
MPIYSKDSLEALRQRVDIIEVLDSHLELKKAGAAYKALCPFHDEKTPSFTVQRGDTHYHCFGCGAHGDAIQFLMTYLKMSFHEAVESLAQKFNVTLEAVEGSDEPRGPAKAKLKEALDLAANFYHFYLLSTEEGHEVLKYLYARGLDLTFIKTFKVGLAPAKEGMTRSYLHSKRVSDEVMIEAGIMSVTSTGRKREFFNERITFPIYAASGHVIGFSARKYKDSTFGGKYINTSETPLFKKSRVLFGLNHSRRRIAKERKAIIVEGQIDALRLIQAGLNITVAGQGTAFGEGHVKELLNLGVTQVYLALDCDNAGKEAACKIGDLFQKQGVEVYITALPEGSDPDTFLNKEGPEAFLTLLQESEDYLTYIVNYHSRGRDMSSPAVKNEMIQQFIKQIRRWDHPLMVHESLRKLAHLTHVPENIVGVGQDHVPNVFIKKQASIGLQTVDPDRILESDLLRWLLLLGGSMPWFVDIARANILPEEFTVTVCRHIYHTFMENTTKEHTCNLLDLVSNLDDAEGQLVLAELLQKKIDKEKAEAHFLDTIQKILNRNWMDRREKIKMKIQSGQCSDDEVLELVKQFDELKREPPKVITESSEAAL